MTAKTTRRRTRRHLATALRLALGAAILVLLFHQVPTAALVSALREVRWPPVTLALVIALASHVAVAIRLQGLVAAFGMRIAGAEIVALTLGALFYGLFLPAGNLTGILVRYVGIARREGNYAGAGVALLLDRLIATVTLCAVGIFFCLLDGRPASRHALLALAAGLVALLAVPAIALHGGIGPLLMRRLPERLSARLVPLRDAMRTARALPRKVVLTATLLGVTTHLLGTAAYALIAQAQGLGQGLAAPGWIRATAVLAAILPASVFGLGPREGTTVLLMGRIDIASAPALAFALLAYATTILAPALLGGALEAARVMRPARTHRGQT